MTRTTHGAGLLARRAAALGAALLLSACVTTPGLAPPVPARTLTATPLVGQPTPPGSAYRRVFSGVLGETPFERGALAVVAREGGFVETFGLVPCGGGRAICAGTEAGPAGTLSTTPDWTVVQGLYGRTFWLSRSGDGYVQRGDVLWPLAWNARVDGRGEGPGARRADGSEVGTDAALDTGAPHR